MILVKGNVQRKVQINGVIDEKVYKCSDLEQHDSCALSKDDYAELVLNDLKYRQGIDFDNFKKIFDVIRTICERGK